MQVARLRENCTCRYAGSAEARLRPPPSLSYYITYRLDRLRELKAIVIIIDMLNFKYGVKYWSTLFFFSEQSQMNGLNVGFDPLRATSLPAFLRKIPF